MMPYCTFFMQLKIVPVVRHVETGLNLQSFLRAFLQTVNIYILQTKSLELVSALDHEDIIHLLPLIYGVENLNITEVTYNVEEESVRQLCLQLLKNRRLKTLVMTPKTWRHVPPAMLDDLTDILEMHNCPADIGGVSPQMFSLRYWHEVFAMNVETAQFINFDSDTNDNNKYVVTPFGAYRRVANQEWSDVYDYHRQIYTTAIALLHNKMVPIDDFVHLCMYEQHYVVRVKGIISNGYFKLHPDIITFLASQKQEAVLKTMEDSKSYIVANAASTTHSSTTQTTEEMIVEDNEIKDVTAPDLENEYDGNHPVEFEFNCLDVTSEDTIFGNVKNGSLVVLHNINGKIVLVPRVEIAETNMHSTVVKLPDETGITGTTPTSSSNYVVWIWMCAALVVLAIIGAMYGFGFCPKVKSKRSGRYSMPNDPDMFDDVSPRESVEMAETVQTRADILKEQSESLVIKDKPACDQGNVRAGDTTVKYTIADVEDCDNVSDTSDAAVPSTSSVTGVCKDKNDEFAHLDAVVENLKQYAGGEHKEKEYKIPMESDV
ncbi:hypothetical protein V5799_005020 [Amblyomma americanum]|uniref:Uncharacterized protein n=1 Tax=Amblyomma americanum TaxID=6943 RepID=A0AAQ4D4F8_AMBAM